MNDRSEQELQEEIQELRSELGETVQALAYKADVPALAKQRGNELKEEAIERSVEAIERGHELKERVLERSGELREQVAVRGSELRDQAVEAAERAREALSRTPRDRWAKLTSAAAALVALTLVLRRVRSR